MTDNTQTTATATGLAEDKIASRREVEIQINLRGLAKAYNKFFHEWPMNGFLSATRKMDEASKNMMTGKAALVTMPLGLMMRNSARIAHNLAEGRYGILRGLVSTVGAASGWAALGYAAFGMLAGVAAVAGTVGTVGAAIGAAVLTAPVILPAFTLSTILAAKVGGIGAAVLSTVPAIANIHVGFRRSLDAFKGIQYDEEALKSKLDEGSVASEYEARRFRKVSSEVEYLPEDKQRKIFERLKERFDTAAQKEQPAEETAPVFAKPAASVKPPKQS
jgi:hypothetical protein